MMRFRTAVVTGASAGIGRELARLLAEDGVRVVAVARDAGRLDELVGALPAPAHGAHTPLPADLTDAGDLEDVAGRVAATDDPVDLVVNNAGFGRYGDLADADPHAETGQVALNVTALLRLTQQAAATFAPRGRGGICNVSSLAGFQPSPGNATYAATKAFVTSLTQAVHEELRPRGVHVSCLCPGYTRTEFHARAGIDRSGLPERAWSDAREVARVGLDGVAHNRAVVVPGTLNKVMAAASQVAPSALSRRVAGRISTAASGGGGG